jgi:hypothetical protein
LKNKQFIYDEKSSSLYAPDGTFLKKVFCPKAMNWNQLIVEDFEDRTRGCSVCSLSVINLDVAEVDDVIKQCNSKWGNTCVYATENSGKVIFLKDSEAPPRQDSIAIDSNGLVKIKTVRSLDDINRAVGMGYWPDVRLVKFDTKNIRSKISVGQDPKTGHVRLSSDYRLGFGTTIEAPEELGDPVQSFLEIHPFESYYPNYQASPIAAYLIPRHLEEGSEVIVEDPIEDIVGSQWNQGDSNRAENVKGRVLNKKIVLDRSNVRVTTFVG